MWVSFERVSAIPLSSSDVLSGYNLHLCRCRGGAPELPDPPVGTTGITALVTTIDRPFVAFGAACTPTEAGEVQAVYSAAYRATMKPVS